MADTSFGFIPDTEDDLGFKPESSEDLGLIPEPDFEGIRQQQHQAEIQAFQQDQAKQQQAAQQDADPINWSTTRLKKHFTTHPPRNTQEQVQMNVLLQQAQQREEQLTAQATGTSPAQQEQQKLEDKSLAGRQQNSPHGLEPGDGQKQRVSRVTRYS